MKCPCCGQETNPLISNELQRQQEAARRAFAADLLRQQQNTNVFTHGLGLAGLANALRPVETPEEKARREKADKRYWLREKAKIRLKRIKHWRRSQIGVELGLALLAFVALTGVARNDPVGWLGLGVALFGYWTLAGIRRCRATPARRPRPNILEHRQRDD